MKNLNRDIDKKVAVVGCKHTTKDLIIGLQRNGFAVDHCVTIGPEKGIEQKVAGYFNLANYLDDEGIPFTVARTYNLKGKNDRETILNLGLDMLLVMGWQRLIPDWLLDSLSIGAFGMHGSSKPLPHGRGRSPMNWSLIQNKEIFYTHLFQYLPGVDDGPVVGVQTFDINQFDDCHTLHFKNTLSMIKLTSDFLPSLLDGSVQKENQQSEGASYYPKRTAEDGLIFWDDTTLNLYNFIRAVTKPFPGAFGFLDDNPDEKVVIWKAIPFDTRLKWPNAISGEIVEVFYDGCFIVKTLDSTLLIQEYEGYKFTWVDVGRKLGNLGASLKVWEDLPS